MTTDYKDRTLKNETREQHQDSFLKTKIEEVVHLKESLNDLRGNLQNEVSELNACRLSLKETITKTTKDSHPELIRLMSESLSLKFQELSSTLDSLLNELKRSHEKQESRLKRSGMVTILFFCLGSFSSGIGLWYFFPQQTNYSLSQRHFEYLREGVMFRHAFKKLPPQDQKKIKDKMGDSWKSYYEELLKG